MTRRVLPVDEYAKLDGLPIAVLLPYLPDGARVIVAEDEHGDVIATWSLFPLWHLEGFWIRDDHRQRGGAARTLLAEMRTQLADVKASRVTTAAETETMCGWLERLGAEQLPGTHYVWPVQES